MITATEQDQVLTMLRLSEDAVLRLYARALLEGIECNAEHQRALQEAVLSIMQRREPSIGAVAIDAIQEVLQWTAQPKPQPQPA